MPCLLPLSCLCARDPSSLDGSPFPLLLEHLAGSLGGSPSPSRGTWPADWRVGWWGGHTALPPNHLLTLLSVCPGPGWAGVRRVLPLGLAFLGGRVQLVPATLIAGPEPAPCCLVGSPPHSGAGWVGQEGSRLPHLLPPPHKPVSLSLPLCPAPDGSSAAAGTGYHVPGLRRLHLL